jgi:hypothetical protein
MTIVLHVQPAKNPSWMGMNDTVKIVVLATTLQMLNDYNAKNVLLAK